MQALSEKIEEAYDLARKLEADCRAIMDSCLKEGQSMFEEKYKEKIQKRDELNTLIQSISNPNYVEVR